MKSQKAALNFGPEDSGIFQVVGQADDGSTDPLCPKKYLDAPT